MQNSRNAAKELSNPSQMSHDDPMVIIETPRLLLRTWTIDNAPHALAIWGDHNVMKFIDSGQTLADLNAARQAVARAIESYENRGLCLWPVVEKASDRLTGCCGFHAFDGGPDLELGFYLARCDWGKGYATEAARACVEYAFHTLAADRIVASTYPDNTASIRVLEKTGFSLVGTKRYGEINELFYELAPSIATSAGPAA